MIEGNTVDFPSSNAQPVNKMNGIRVDIVEYKFEGTRTSSQLWDWNKFKSANGSHWKPELTALLNQSEDVYIPIRDNLLGIGSDKFHYMPPLLDTLSVQKTIKKILKQWFL